MRDAIRGLVVTVMLASGARAQIDPTVPLPPRVVGVFVPSGNLERGGRMLQTATTWTEAAEAGTLGNPVGVAPLETRGFVLVAGGAGIVGGKVVGLASAEAYGPSIRTSLVNFPSVQPVGAMTNSRIGHSATLLADGRILIAGGQTNPGLENQLTSAEVYDPETKTFSRVGEMTAPRMTHRAVRLRDGRVLIVGGLQAVGAPGCAPSCQGVALASAEIFDPATGRFTPTGSMATARALGHSTSLLADGRVLVAGGVTNPADGIIKLGQLEPALRSTEVFNPASGSFTPGPPMVTGRTNHTATRLFGVEAEPSLLGWRVFFAGGSSFAGVNLIYSGPLSSAETFSPFLGVFTADGSMATPRTQHAAVLLPHGKVLVSGGLSSPGESPPSTASVVATAEIYDPGPGPNPLTGLFPAPGVFVPPPAPMTTPRWAHTASLTPADPAGTAVLIAGAATGGPTTATEAYLP